MRDLGSNEGAAKVPEVNAETASVALDCRRVSYVGPLRLLCGGVRKVIEEERLSRDTFCLKPCGWKLVSLFSDPERETCSP